MKMYVQQKVFRLADEFTVYDENKQPLYYVYGKLFSWSKQSRICDAYNQDVGMIKQKIFSFLPRFQLYIDDVVVAEVKKRFSLFHPSYNIEGLNWQCDGDFWAHNYSITHNDEIIATIKKEWLSWGDFYTIDVADEDDSLEVLLVCLTIDACLQMNNSSVSVNSDD
ncbi:MAG: LURP-one-related/scramblase family protein [Erysipelotrichaceae bacterium]|jgi:uncharacterized protein YxjI